MLRQRYEAGSLIATSNLPFAEWTGVLGRERLTVALLDRLTHRVPSREANGESYRLHDARILLQRRQVPGNKKE